MDGWRRAARLSLVRTLAVVVALGAGAQALAAEVFEGRVVRVTDGDTLSVQRGDDAVTVRLEGIDAPELGQAFGDRATRRLRELSRGQVVTVYHRIADRHGRPIAVVLLPDGRSLSRILVSEGLAWQFREYSNSLDLEALEALARSAKRGLWSEPTPLAPWEFRRLARARAPAGPNQPPERPAGPVHANRRSGIYHLPHCASWSSVSDTNREVFIDAREAEAKGYRRAKGCDP